MGRIIRPKDRLGIPYEMDGKLFIDAVVSAALNQGTPVIIAPGALAWALTEIDAASGDVVGGLTGTPATLAVLQYVGIPERDMVAKEIARFVIGGVVKALVSGDTNVTKADYLEIINGATNFIQDGTAKSVNSVAMALETYNDAATALKDVFMLGIPLQIAAA